MPRLPIDFSRTIIYKLCCLDQSITDIYVGSTTDFKNRKRCHKCNCNNENSKGYNLYVYQFIRLHGGFENWNMVQVEQYPCNNSREAQARETYWMKELKSTLNSRQSFLTKKERKENLKEYNKSDKFKEYQKKYYKSDKGKDYKKQWHQKKALYLNQLKCYNL